MDRRTKWGSRAGCTIGARPITAAMTSVDMSVPYMKRRVSMFQIVWTLQSGLDTEFRIVTVLYIDIEVLTGPLRSLAAKTLGPPAGWPPFGRVRLGHKGRPGCVGCALCYCSRPEYRHQIIRLWCQCGGKQGYERPLFLCCTVTGKVRGLCTVLVTRSGCGVEAP